MKVDVRTELELPVPVDAAASFAADPDRVAEWYANIQSVEWLTPRPLQVGTRLAFVARFLGRRLAYTYEVVELDLPRRLRMRTEQGPFPMETTYTWEARGPTASWMELRNAGEPSGFAGLTAPLMAAAMRRATTQDLARLRARLTAGQPLGSTEQG